MKTLKLFLALNLFGLIALAQNPANPNPPGNAYGLYHHFSSVTKEDVVVYLEKTGHRILTEPRTEDAGKTWYCYTQLEDGRTYYTVVYTDGENILGFDDSAIG